MLDYSSSDLTWLVPKFLYRFAISIGVLFTYWPILQDGFSYLNDSMCDVNDDACFARALAHDSGPIMWLLILILREIANLALCAALHMKLQERVEQQEDIKGCSYLGHRFFFLFIAWVVHAIVGCLAVLIAGVVFTVIGVVLIVFLSVTFVCWFSIYDCCCCCAKGTGCTTGHCCTGACCSCATGTMKCCICTNTTRCCTCCGAYSVPALVACVCPLYGIFIYFWVWTGSYYTVLGSEWAQPFIGVPHIFFLLDVTVPLVELVPELLVRGLLVVFGCREVAFPPPRPDRNLANRENEIAMQPVHQAQLVQAQPQQPQPQQFQQQPQQLQQQPQQQPQLQQPQQYQQQQPQYFQQPMMVMQNGAIVQPMYNNMPFNNNVQFASPVVYNNASMAAPVVYANNVYANPPPSYSNPQAHVVYNPPQNRQPGPLDG